jgi:heme A synthase
MQKDQSRHRTHRKWPSRRLPGWAAFPLQTVLFTLSMAMVMSFVLTMIRLGPVEDFAARALRNAAMAFPIALCASLLIGPIVRKIVAAVAPSGPPPAEEPPTSIIPTPHVGNGEDPCS